MTWTLLAIIGIVGVALLAFVGARFGVLERRPIIYTQKERFGWAIAFAAIPLLGGADLLFGVALAVAIYFSGPVYHQYRIVRHRAKTAE